MHKADITIIVPTKNEEKNLAFCLEPIYTWANKIIIVDSRSTDETCKIADSFGAEVIQFDYKGGWPKKRQHILDTYSFKTSWVMLLDSDEILTPESKEEIEAAIQNPEIDGYYMFFRIEFLGRMLYKADPGLRKLSLFRAGRGSFEMRLENQDSTMGDMEVHEHVIVNGKTANLVMPILHRNINSLSRYIIKHDEYSNYECLVHIEGAETGISANFFGSTEQRRRYIKKKLIRNKLAPILFFFYLFFLKRGFLDRSAGFYFIIYQCMYLYFVSSKIYEIEQSKIK